MESQREEVYDPQSTMHYYDDEIAGIESEKLEQPDKNDELQANIKKDASNFDQA